MRSSETEQNRFGVKPVNGKWKEFNKHGLLVAEGHYLNGQQHGRWHEYYNTGELAIIQHYDNGEPHGSYTSFHANGQVWSQGNHVNGRCEGVFHVYNEEGDVVRLLFFNDGILVEDRELNKAKTVSF